MDLSIEVIIRDYQSDIQKYIRKVACRFNIQDADILNDIAQEIYLRILEKKMDGFNGTEPAQVRRYLFRMVYNLFVTYLNKGNRISGTDIHDMEDFTASSGTDNPETILLNKEMVNLIQNEISSMNTDQQLLFKIIYIDGRKQKDAAIALGVVQSVISDRCRVIEKTIQRALELYGER